jgi:hypothetical protein
VRLAARVLVTVIAVAPAAAAADRPVHGSVGFGGSLVWTGDRGDRSRLDVELDLEPRSRYGAIVAWRAFDRDHHGLVMAGLVFEAAAARPRLVLDLHADAGADLDARAPLVGGGLRTTITLHAPIAIALDSGGYLVLDGVDDTRLQLQGNVIVVVRW